MNEWAFAAEVESWWDSEFSSHPEWRLTRCEVETREADGLRRSDLTVFGQGIVILCGELRLPDHPIPSPWHPDNLADAINKALSHQSRWAFTSDGIEFLLIDTTRQGPPSTRVVERLALVPFQSRDELDSESFLARVRLRWQQALRELAPLVAGLAGPRGMAADEQFINSLRAVLSPSVAAVRDELNRRRLANSDFADRLVRWMVDAQAWVHVPENWESEVLRVSQLTTYVLTTRLMFYEALRRSNPSMPALQLPVGSAQIAQATLNAYFEDARVRSGDYETLFTWDEACEFALAGDAIIVLWQRIISYLTTFDLAHIGYDLLGRMFERLIDPLERYRWGQHYTNPDVVDLMLSFAIPDGEGSILDPAVGGGTFLVRAYARKRVLHPQLSHQQLLTELYGVDISAFAATLATGNLAVRQLDFEDNYPQVTENSFFQIEPQQAFMTIPRMSLAGSQLEQVAIPPVRALTFNPPYVRIHELGEARKQEAAATLAVPGRSVPVPNKVSGLANYHIYFWFHGAQFLEPEGRLVIITSGEWLDSDYGAVLQKWLLDRFRIECLIESIAEPWFSEARVGTVVLSAQLSADPRSRDENQVRFVLLRKTLPTLFGESGDAPGHFGRVDALRDRIMSLSGPTGQSDDLDWSVATQADLRRLGTVVR